jgi:hypothetical protein
MLIHKENKIMKNKWIKMVALERTMNECIGNHYTEEDDRYTEWRSLKWHCPYEILSRCLEFVINQNNLCGAE